MYDLIKPFIFLLPAETAHSLGMLCVKFIGFLHRFGIWPRPHWAKHPKLQTNTPFGKISSPLGLAAGLDKNAQGLWGWQALGFGFVEVGTATPVAQPGNPKPRLFRYVRHQAIVNRMGFNNIGVKAIAENVRRAKKNGLQIKIGGNIGKNFSTPSDQAGEDYKRAAIEFSDCVDYLVINVSSPNTPGLRDLQSEKNLDELVSAVRSVVTDIPLFIKVAPDNQAKFIDGVLNVARKHMVCGIICGNTLANHASAYGLSDREILVLPNGGLSGRPVFSTNLALTQAYVEKSNSMLIIGVGGIADTKQAMSYFQAGAGLIQVYTGFIFGGPRLIKNILKDLAKA
ncbi:MAG: quinone-dependent dihydroorotate dehydrogenase [Oligoflexia bacterium]|nr:quinone-dependent dihydroorotate dehydrogenase [Oligoflexia bacterium]